MIEKRWYVLAQNGGHAAVARGGPPEEAVLIRAADGLSAMGLGGWLAVEETLDNQPPVFREVMRLGNPRRSWECALDSMRAVRAGSPRGDLPTPPDVPMMRM